MLRLCVLLVGSVAAVTPAAPQRAAAGAAATRMLFQAAFSGNDTRVKWLLREHGRIIDIDGLVGDTTVLIAALNGKHALLERFDASNAASLPSRAAAYDSVLRSLLKYGAHAGVMCPILDAITFRNRVGARMLMKGMNASELQECLSMRTTLGQNLLHDASKSPASGYARMLFRSRGVGNGSLTAPLLPLMLMSRFPTWTRYEELFKTDVDEVAQDDMLRLVIQAAAAHNSSVLHDMLQGRDHEDRTPLLIACADGRAAAVRMLLDAGANATHTSASHGGRTCADTADVLGYTDIAAMARSHMNAAATATREERRPSALQLHHFDAAAHNRAGWATASHDELAALHIDFAPRDEHAASGVPVLMLQGVPSADANATLQEALGSDSPFIIRGWQPAIDAAAVWWDQQAFLSRVGGLNVRIGSIPYASTYGFQARTLNISAFVAEHMRAGLRPEGERMYVFDGSAMHANAAAFADVLAAFPPHLRETRAHGMQQMMLGPALSGAMPHFHGAAVNLLLFGLKLWFVYPPAHAHFAQRPVLDWYEKVYLRREGCSSRASGVSEMLVAPNARASPVDTECAPLPHLTFLQEPGDIVHVPSHWGHAVLNLADTFAIALE